MCVLEETVEVDRELHDAINAFENIEKHATHDVFLQVYSKQNHKLFRVTKAQYDKVMGACKSHAFSGMPDKYKDERYMKSLEKENAYLKSELNKLKELGDALSTIKSFLK